MSATMIEAQLAAARDPAVVRGVLEGAVVGELTEGRRPEARPPLTPPAPKRVCDAYGIAVPQEGLATSADEAVALFGELGHPVVLKVVSPDILHKTEAKGVLVGLSSAREVAAGYHTIVANAKAYHADAHITGVQV